MYTVSISNNYERNQLAQICLENLNAEIDKNKQF